MTAKLVAYARQQTDIMFASDVSEYIGAERAVRDIVSKMDDGKSSLEERTFETIGFAPLLEARYKSIAALISKSGINQVLELASGFSLRGLAMAQDENIRYVETDLQELNAEKIPLIAALRMRHQLPDHGNHCVVSASALNIQELVEAVETFDREKPLIVTFEGLMPYLSSEEQETLAENVREVLVMFNGGAWINPDFTTKEIAASGVTDSRKRFRDAVNSSTSRNLHESAFESEEAIERFIQKHGFRGDAFFQTDVVPNLVSPARLGLSQAQIESLKPRMRIWFLSLQ